MKNDPLMEYVDDEDNIVGTLPRSEIIKQKKTYRLIAVFVFDRNGRIFLQKRSDTIKRYPSHYESSAGGHVEAGESYEHAAERELKEELGISCDNLKFVIKKRVGYENISKFVSLFMCILEDEIVIDKKVIQEGEFFDVDEIKRMILSGEKFTPVFVNLFMELYK